MSATVVQTPQMTTGEMIARYIALRDKKEEIQDAHKKQLAPYNDVLKRLEGMLLDHLNLSGIESLRADAGTAFRTTHTSAKVENWNDALDYIKNNDAWELLEARVSKTAALLIVEETGKPIPGVTISQIASVNVRRA